MRWVGRDGSQYGQAGPASWVVPLACILLTVVGCKTAEKPPPQPLPAPAASVKATHYRGTTLSGPLAQATALAPASAARVDVRIVAAVKAPADQLTPIGPQARLILRDGEGDLVSPSGRLGYSTLFRSLDSADSLDALLGDRVGWADLGSASGLVMKGSTFAVDITPPPDGATRLVSVQVFRSADGNRYELAIQREELSTTAANAGPARPLRETIVIPRDLAANGATAERLLLTLPMAFAGTTVSSLVIDLAINFTPGGVGPLLDQADKDLADSLARETARLQTAPPTDPVLAAARDALAAGGENARRPLTYLAQLTGARIAEAVALVADDALLSVISKNVREKLPQVKADDAASVGWLLEQSTIQSVASMKDAENAAAALAPVQGVLQGIAGQAGVQLDVLQSIAGESAGTADLYNRLIAEHLIFLEDSSPAVRVRSYDWLKARKKEPPEYDPLGRPKERRAALEKFREKATAAATQPR